MARSAAAASNDDDELKAPLLVEAGFSELVSPLLTPEFGRPEEIPDCPLDDSNIMVEKQEHDEATPVEDAGLFRDAPATNDNNHNNDEDHDEYWFSNPHQVSAMLSNFSTSYNVVNISLVLPILEASSSSSVEPDEDAVAAVASSLLAGMMLGQVLGGLCGDLFGPLTALRLVMLLQVAASLGSASVVVAAADSSSSQIYWRLALWRFILGVGAGGVYPLAATLSASAGHLQQQQQNLAAGSAVPNDDKSSLHRVVLTFSTQGLGFVAVPLVTVPLLYSLPHNLNVIWRIILGLGSVPGISLMIWQFRTMRKHQQNDGTAEPPPITRTTTSHSLASQHGVIPPPDYVSDDENNQESDEENESVLDSLPDRPNAVWSLVTRQSQEPPSSSSSSPVAVTTADPASPVTQEPQEHKGWWDSVRHEEDLARKLLGTAATWFLFDVLFYGNTLFEPVVIEAAFGPRQHTNPVHLLQRTAVDSLILTSIALPGYAVAGWVLGRKTRWCYCGLFRQSPRFVMLQGFAVMALLYLVLGLFWTKLRRFPALLVTLYGLSFFFANYGPNTTTFVLPSLVYSPECRSTFNGLSAAAGKLGALTGASLFEPAADALGDSSVMLICTVIAILALILTKLFVPQSDGSNNYSQEPESPSSEEYAAPTEQPRATAIV